MKRFFVVLLAAISMTTVNATAEVIGRNTSVIKSDLMTPEVLWAMGRIGAVNASADGSKIVYNVTYYSVPQDKSRSVLYLMDVRTCRSTQLTDDTNSESGAVFFDGDRQLLFLCGGKLFAMNVDGSNRREIATGKADEDIDEFLLSPDEKKIVLIRQVESTSSIQKNPDDLPKSTGMVINDMMYKHWDHFVKTIPHPFVADFSAAGVGEETDVLEGEPYECPMLPFGGVEELSWSPDSKSLAYTCRKKVGKAYSMSTDSDIFLYELATRKTTNLCKPEGWVEPETDDTRSYEDQAINHLSEDCSVGYDQDPQFSPDGKYIAWLSMERAGYEADRMRLCVYDFATGKKNYVSEAFQSNVDTYCWDSSSQSLYFAGSWRGTEQVYSTNFKGELRQLSKGDFDCSVQGLLSDGRQLLIKRHSMSQADEIYLLDIKGKPEKNITQLTHENSYFYDNLTLGEVKERWVTTTDGKQMLCFVVYPPHFDPNKKYPTLLICEGGPQSPVGQGWSYRWNFQLMAAQGYITVHPARRGVPGFGMEWLEEISGDYAGQCMQDLLSGIDDMCKEPYVDTNRLGCVGASFGGYSVYWLAGHHEGRFKAFISHDGIYNEGQQYVETDELWFPNWDLKGAPWRKDVPDAQRVYSDSPHLSVDKWDTPILCIHGMKDYRIMFTQAESAFQAAKMRGIPAQLLLLPDENHWVLHPQNAILWQRTFFGWLDRWLK